MIHNRAMAQLVRRVLVLGATGHIGAQFAAACRCRGLEVEGLSRRGGDSTRAADLTRPEALEQLEGFDVVINATDTSRDGGSP